MVKKPRLNELKKTNRQNEDEYDAWHRHSEDVGELCCIANLLSNGQHIT